MDAGELHCDLWKSTIESLSIMVNDVNFMLWLIAKSNE